MLVSLAELSPPEENTGCLRRLKTEERKSRRRAMFLDRVSERHTPHRVATTDLRDLTITTISEKESSEDGTQRVSQPKAPMI